MERDYSAISPSARSLLMMKALTPIPFAKEAAELISKDENSFPEEKDLVFWMRTMHFEERYTSVDQLMEDLEATNILELSSGFSFRGLELARRRKGIHYIDTDLPELIKVKKQILADLNVTIAEGSKMDLLAMNALGRNAFQKTVNSFPTGPVTIVNEGLLMYLGDDEKNVLIENIKQVLRERDGCWITGDIYIKNQMAQMAVTKDDELSKLVEREKIEEKKFEDFEQAREYFENAGFEIDKVAVPDYTSLSSLGSLLEKLPAEVANSKEPPPRIHETWRLKLR